MTTHASKMVGRYGFVGCCATLLSMLACNTMLGIEDAKFDAELEALTAGGSAATSGTLGGSGSAGASGSARGGNAGSAGKAGGGGTGGESGAKDPGTGGVLGNASMSGNAGEDTGPGEGGAGGSAPAVPATLCERYCESVQASCIDENAQYGSYDQCLTICQMFPEGSEGAVEGNNVACRLKRAEIALDAPTQDVPDECRRAGPGGGDTNVTGRRCGSSCEGLCSMTLAICTPEASPFFYFQDYKACIDSCAGVPEVPWVYGSDDIATGNTVQCRLYHAISAVVQIPDEHCEHAMGATVCTAGGAI